MKNRLLSSIICLLLAASVMMPLADGLRACASVNDVTELIDGTIGFKVGQAGAGSVQELIDGTFCKTAGTSSQWYALALRQYEKGYDFSEFAGAVQKYAVSNSQGSAVTRQRCALVIAACGYSSDFVLQTVNSTIGSLGIMSRVFGLHLLNIGFKSTQYTASQVFDSLLSLRLDDGGWALSGENADVDVTAMVIQSLAPYYTSDANVSAAVGSAVALLSSRQLASGNFKSYGVENPESTAQVITALAALGIDCLNDSRFIKEGNSLLDGLKKYRLANGGFCHEQGSGYNDSATFQALYSLVALWRSSVGKGSLYAVAYPSKSFPTENTTAKPSPHIGVPAATQPMASTAPVSATAVTSTTRRRIETVPYSSRLKSAKNVASAAASTAAAQSAQGVTAISAANVVAQTAAFESTIQEETGTLSQHGQSTVTSPSRQEASADVERKEAGGSGKKIAVTAIWLGALAACAVLLLCGKKRAVNFVAVAVVAALLTGAALSVNIESRDSFYCASSVPCTDENAVTVTLTIRCDTIAAKSDKDYIPSDGVILDTTEFTVSEGSTVFDVLMLAAKQNKIQTENKSQTGENYETAYISGINYIYEFDFGELSGWMYRVNSESPSVGCGVYKLSQGDRIEWLYTCNLGDDLK